MNNRILFTVILVLLFASCRRVAPQGPANQPREDSAAIALVEMHFRLAEEADRQLVDSVKQSDKKFTLSEYGFWYNRSVSTDGEEVKRNDEVEYQAQICALDGSLIENVSSTTRVGTREVILAIDCCLPMMRVGEQFEIYAPYYNAYGVEGENGVAPLTNVHILLQVNDIR